MIEVSQQEVVMIGEGHALIYREALFCGGWNVYKRFHEEHTTFIQISPHNGWFKTKEAALDWLWDHMDGVR